MQQSRLAKIVLNGLVMTISGGLIGATAHKFLGRIRAGLVATTDPLVEFEIGGFNLLIPLSSNLPLHTKILPQYATNIARIVKHVARKYSDLSIVDIGANVGDTAALMRQQTSAPILCVEGEDRFFKILEQNRSQLGGDVVLERCFVGEASSVSSVRVDSHRGTARVVANENGVQVSFKTLRDILDNRPLFRRPKFIKIDTDGFDCRILKGQTELLKQMKSVVFFEYDPFLFEAAGDDGFAVFEALRKAGYRHALIYENSGDYLLTVDISDQMLLEDIHSFYSGRREQRYCDICVFHEEDEDLCQTVRRSEIEFFSRFRSESKP